MAACNAHARTRARYSPRGQISRTELSRALIAPLARILRERTGDRDRTVCVTDRATWAIIEKLSSDNGEPANRISRASRCDPSGNTMRPERAVIIVAYQHRCDAKVPLLRSHYRHTLRQIMRTLGIIGGKLTVRTRATLSIRGPAEITELPRSILIRTWYTFRIPFDISSL